jgi:hypothetical protein
MRLGFANGRSGWAAMILTAGFGLAACGCGLNDYEQHVDAELAYLKDFDEENKYLAEAALEMPKKLADNAGVKMEVDAFSTAFFLRPPIWIAVKPMAGEKPFTSGRVALYRYPGPSGYNLLFTEASLDKEPVTKTDIKDGLAPADFRAQVRGALVQFMQRAYQVNEFGWANDDKTTKVSFPVKNFHGRPGNLEFEKQEFNNKPAAAKDDDKYHAFEVYYHTDGATQAAIVYELPPSMTREQKARKTLDLSLRAFALGPDSLSRSQEQAMRVAKRRASVKMRAIEIK